MKVKEHLGLKISFLLLIVMIIVTALIGYFLIQQQTKMLKDQIMRKGETLATIGSQIMEVKLGMGVELEYFTVQEAFDSTYTVIPGTDPVKYRTRTDSYFDDNIQGIEDSFLKDKSIVYAVLVDRNGYLPTHNSIYSKPLSGNYEQDLFGNRTKRKFDDPIGLKAAQNTEGILVQEYERDTGEILLDISMPVKFVDQHWGAFRIGFSMQEMNQQLKSLTYSIAIVMLVLIILLSVTTFLLINRSVSELKKITDLASHMADGNLNKEIQTSSRDEIGKLADVLERMRISLKMSIEEIKKIK